MNLMHWYDNSIICKSHLKIHMGKYLQKSYHMIMDCINRNITTNWNLKSRSEGCSMGERLEIYANKA